MGKKNATESVFEEYYLVSGDSVLLNDLLKESEQYALGVVTECKTRASFSVKIKGTETVVDAQLPKKLVGTLWIRRGAYVVLGIRQDTDSTSGSAVTWYELYRVVHDDCVRKAGLKD